MRFGQIINVNLILKKIDLSSTPSTQALDQSYENTKVKSIVLTITFLQINNLDPAVTRVGHSVSVYWDSGLHNLWGYQ